MEEVHPFVSKRHTEADDQIIDQAMAILRKRLEAKDNVYVHSHDDLCKYLCTRVGKLEHEAFGAVFLGIDGELIAAQELFRGTLTQVSVYPREVVKAALAYNAQSVVIYHNHPGGNPEPSQPDIQVSRIMDTALKTVGIILLDHFVIAGDKHVSMDEQGLMPGNARRPGLPPELMQFLEHLQQGGRFGGFTIVGRDE